MVLGSDSGVVVAGAGVVVVGEDGALLRFTDVMRSYFDRLT